MLCSLVPVGSAEPFSQIQWPLSGLVDPSGQRSMISERTSAVGPSASTRKNGLCGFRSTIRLAAIFIVTGSVASEATTSSKPGMSEGPGRLGTTPCFKVGFRINILINTTNRIKMQRVALFVFERGHENQWRRLKKFRHRIKR